MRTELNQVQLTDRNGLCSRLTIPKEYVDAADAELSAMIEAIESEES